MAYLLKNNFIIIIITASIIWSFSSCNAVKYVPENKHLLTKNKVFVNNKKKVDNEISDYIIQRPNQLVLGIPLPLHFYNIGNKNFQTDFNKWKKEKPGWYKFTTAVFSEKQAKGLRKFKYNMHNWWLKNGEPPVILDSLKMNQSAINLKNHFFNEGFFNAYVTPKINYTKNKRAQIEYYINTGKPYVIDSIKTHIESAVLDSIYNNKSNSFIKKGEQFKYSLFENEQNRISKLFRNSGIYRFNKNAILVEVDSIKHKTNIDLIINDSIADVPFKIQKIKKINVYTDFSYNNRNNIIKDSATYLGINFLAQQKLNYNPKILFNSIFIAPNQIYKDENRELTRKHLRNLNNFKSVNIKYSELPNDDLLASIYLTPLKKYSLGFNTELNHSNIRQLGISGKLSFTNRNIFKGAELLKFSIQGSFLDSKDAATNDKLLNAWEIGGDVSLILPRFLLPFNSHKIVPKKMSPKTTFTLGTSLQKNIGLDKQKFTGIIDFTWKSSKYINQSLQLLNAQFIKNLNTSSYFNIYQSEFNDILQIATTYFNTTLTTDPTDVLNFIDTNITTSFQNTNPSEYNTAQNIKKRYNIITEDVLVPALTYSFTFNNSENYKDTDFSFFRTRIVSSGLLSTFLSKTKDNNGNKTLLKTPIAQYIRTDIEYKKFWKLNTESVLAFRNFLGIAYPYGNSNTLPFSRSYFIGGPNDLRAWKIYDLGPGSSKTGLEYNVGSLKFLTSLEYRFKIINSIKGALFIDSGNIWDITNSEVTSSESKFKGFKSLSEIAIGSGFGIRYDLSFILLRLDLGFKTYEPYLSKKKRWFTHYNFNNTVFNFGISYPF
ncbi:MAG: translocation and assembly module lipoprotein TamL [Lutibacter sp.]